jgi:HEAT repeat protein
MELLEHPQLEVRREAAAILGHLGDDRAVAVLLECHERDWPEVQRAASASLVRLGVDATAPNGRCS